MATSRMRSGERGERIAGDHLSHRGYAILEKNYRCRYGEIDIVAQQDANLVFVEVRTRRSAAFGTAQESITPAKAAHLIAASEHYLERHALEDTEWRIDLISLNWPAGTSMPVIEHLEWAVGAGQA